MAAFNDLAAAGTWTLEIIDNAKGDTDTLNRWSIEIATYEAPGVPGITVDSTSGLVRPPKPSLVIRRRRSPEQRATLARLDLVRSLRTGRRLWSRLVPSKRRPRMS